MTPAVITTANASVTLAVESVEKMDGAGTTVAPAVTVENNPGLTYLTVLVYYSTVELAQGDTHKRIP